MSAEFTAEGMDYLARLFAPGSPPDQIVMHPWDYLRIKHGERMEQLHERLMRRLKYPGGRKARSARLRLALRRRP